MRTGPATGRPPRRQPDAGRHDDRRATAPLAPEKIDGLGRLLAHQREVVATVELGLAVGLFPLLPDQVGALLGIGALQRGIIIDTVLLEVVEAKQAARPPINPVCALP